MSVCIACGRPWRGRALQCDECRAGERPKGDSTAIHAHARRAAPDGPDLFAEWCVQQGLPRPVAEHRFAPPRRWRFDWAWPDLRVAVEQEGGVWTGGRHVRGKGYVGDMEKYTRASLEGWTLIRRTPADLCTPETLAMLRAAMGRAA